MPKAKSTRSNSRATPSNRAASVTAEQSNGNSHANNYPEEAIRARAYQLYEARGRENGFDQDDWFRAEAEITAPTSK